MQPFPPCAIRVMLAGMCGRRVWISTLALFFYQSFSVFLPVGLTQSVSPCQFIIIASADREKEAELEEESKTEINGEGKGAVSLSCISNIIATPAFITIKQLSGNTIICSSVVCIKLFYSPQKSESHPERRICLGNLKAAPRGGFVWA